MNIFVHYLTPVTVIIDWFLTPIKTKITWKDASLWFIFPTIYLIYSFIRALLVGWYPYYFLNPNEIGTLGVIECVIIIFMGEVIASWAIINCHRKVA